MAKAFPAKGGEKRAVGFSRRRASVRRERESVYRAINASEWERESGRGSHSAIVARSLARQPAYVCIYAICASWIFRDAGRETRRGFMGFGRGFSDLCGEGLLFVSFGVLEWIYRYRERWKYKLFN